MVKLKQIRLVNFGGIEDSTFIFTQSGLQLDGYVPPSLRTTETIIPISLFYGPNGIGKSTILEAIRFVANPKVFYGRNQAPDVYLRPWVRDNEFIPLSDHILAKTKSKMRIEALFTDGIKDYEVLVTNSGFEKNELPERPEGAASGGNMYYVDADNPINWSKFQLISTDAQRFIDLAEAIYGYPCDLDGDVTDSHCDDEGNVLETQTYYQDFIITKGKAKVHFARMSAGEKKIATMIRQLCNPDNIGDRDIILIDNWEMHVYFKRHPKMIAKLKEYFSGKQIIATTHSQSMIEYGAKMPYVKNFDLEEYKPEYKMLEQITETQEEETPKFTVNDIEKEPGILGEIRDETWLKIAAAAADKSEPVGFTKRTIMTPTGEMTVIVPTGSDKARLIDSVDEETGKVTKIDPLQNLINGAVKIDVDEEGNLLGYVDPNKNKFKPGSGQIKRVSTQLSPGQRRRMESGESIITGPVTVAGTAEHSINDFNPTRAEAVKNTIAAEISIAESKESAIAAVQELGRGGCCANFDKPTLVQAAPDVIPTPVEGVLAVSIPDKVERPELSELTNTICSRRGAVPDQIVETTPEDIADMQSQLTAIPNDPNLTIVTHSATVVPEQPMPCKPVSREPKKPQGFWAMVGSFFSE